ncbi:GNAT family N-acetyltransferase [Flavobacterium sp. UMI-01]|uniref:GNAT family N-acetyltransferase n=1 Tax=Flavobacterium sp. UMI-01 TaxID=1441053 RepID=UPI001C7DD9AF|nr:GNAT family N-acetyltransferase [Flavobacterium sp. UMI-01]GIZ10129.1 hypothetical protein FUMI01_28550 [Flavobacterium sp. UMI-01]
MKTYHIKRYTATDYKQWNDFVQQAKNATFLFHRDFMEYHKDRFEDYSLMVYEGTKLVAVLPANRVGEVVHSHQGLSYGGLVYGESLKLASVIAVFQKILFFLNENTVSKINLKLIPSIYHNKPAEELQYALFLVNAKLIRRDSLSVVDLVKNISISKDRKNNIKKGKRNDLVIKEEVSFDLFWNEVLIPNLEVKHNSKPVHSITEISYLKSIFPNNIRQFNVYKGNQIIAGTTIFTSENVAHSQYISKNNLDKNYRSLDFLHAHLLFNVFRGVRFFDFGISNEMQGRKLNEGLSYWKESFGASTIAHDFYEVKTSDFYLLENIFV